MSKEIKLTQGKVAIIDDEDADRVLKHKWHAHNNHGRGWYARTTIKNKSFWLHRFVMLADVTVQIDHANGDGLDCRKSNLRSATRSQNGANRKPHRNNTSGYRGVWFGSGSAHATIGYNNKDVYLGSFATAEEAAQAYDAKARELFGEFARTNF